MERQKERGDKEGLIVESVDFMTTCNRATIGSFRFSRWPSRRAEMTLFSSTAHASTSTLRPPSDLRTRSPHYSPSTQIWSPQCNLCNMYSYVTSLRWPCALIKNRKQFSTVGQREQSTSWRKLPVDVNSVLGHIIENSLISLSTCWRLVPSILSYFGKRKQVTKVTFLVKEQNVSVISTDGNWI